jgi:hypothetical protein
VEEQNAGLVIESLIMIEIITNLSVFYRRQPMTKLLLTSSRFDGKAPVTFESGDLRREGV